MYEHIKKILFSLDAERAHDLSIGILSRIGVNPVLRRMLIGSHPPTFAQAKHEVLGLKFDNPVGLAAGLDKHASAVDGLLALGFGWVEVGTVTPMPQSGNPKPRLFRLPEHEALINRMGFNSVGLEKFTSNLRRQRAVSDGTGIVSVNIGKNATTPIAAAADDYLTGLEAAYPYASLITANISSPNTPELRNLQLGNHVGSLLAALGERRESLSDETGRRLPLLIKIAPDGMTRPVIEHLVSQSLNAGIDGIIATNTSIERTGVKSHPLASEPGGLSGRPIEPMSRSTLELLSEVADGRITLISCGGIHNACVAAQRIDVGASLIQLYTAFVYQGPALIHQLVNGLKNRT